MIISRIETFTEVDTRVCFVKVTTDDGLEGIGQIAPSNADISATVLHRQVARCYLGESPLLLEKLAQKAVEINYKFPWSYVCRAVGGIDTALWDLIGRMRGKSVCEMLGGTPRPFPVYGSSMSRSITPEPEAERAAVCTLSAQKTGMGYQLPGECRASGRW